MYQRTLAVHTQHLTGFGRIDCDTAHANLLATGIHDFHQVILFKITLNASDSYRQYTDSLFPSQSCYRLLVQVQFSFSESFTVSNPFLDTRHIRVCRNEPGTHSLFGMLQNINQDIVLLPIGDDYRNAFISNFTGYCRLREHTSSPETGFLGLYIV